MIKNGIDIVKISRIEKSLENTSFFEKVFGENEREELIKRNMPPESIAAAFAAKEAFGKAFEVGISGFSLCEVQVIHKDNGAPFFLLSGCAKELAEKENCELALSISHDGEYAIAIVTVFFEENQCDKPD